MPLFPAISQWRPSNPVAMAIGTLSVLVLGLVDYMTGYEVSMFVFYAAPIVAIAWFANKKCALLLALIAGLTWWWVDQLTLHPYRWGWIQAWETLVRLAFFLFAAVSGATIKAHHENTVARIHLLERSYELEKEIINAAEQEQRRIGQDLHDGVCQYLVALGYSASSLAADLKNAGQLLWASSARDLADRLKEGAVQTRELARGLVPVQVGEAGLTSALSELTQSISELLKIDCRFHDETNGAQYDHPVSTQLYRIAQEAINNATRHGQARRIDVTLCSIGEESALMISDNGLGIQSRVLKSKGIGLKVMEYRARHIGGRLQLLNRANSGTVVRCVIPQSHLQVA